MGGKRAIRKFISSFCVILRNETSLSRAEILTYLKLKLKHLIFIRKLKRDISSENIFGFKVKFFNYPNFIFMFNEIFVDKDYYFNTTARHPFIIDCGANIGMALLFFKRLYPDSRIIAFEPDKETFEILKENVEMNGLRDIELFNKAVHDSEGPIDFYYDQDCPGSLLMSAAEGRLPKARERVDSVLLSDYIEGSVDFLKMDIEGSEDLAIHELSEHNKLKLVKEMVIEYHHHIQPKDDKFSTILKILEENGFGYQIKGSLGCPFGKEQLQDILIHAYQK